MKARDPLPTRQAANQALSVRPPARAEADANRLTRETGSPLPADVRTRMEARFGADFSRVQVHANPAAAGVATALGARAFTLGQRIAFNTGEFAPRSARGERLLAHELAHVLQQRDAQGGFAPFERNPRDEREADAAAARVHAGLAPLAPARLYASPRIQAEQPKAGEKPADAAAPQAGTTVTFVLRAPDDEFTRDVTDYVKNTLKENVVEVNNLHEAADYLEQHARNTKTRISAVRIVGHGSTTGGIKMTPKGETDRRFVSAEELEKMAADKTLTGKAGGAMAEGATVEFWGCHIGATPKSTAAVSTVFNADVKAIDDTLKTTFDEFLRPADKGEEGQKVAGQKGSWVGVRSAAEIDDRVKAGNKNLGKTFDQWLVAQSRALEAEGDLPAQADDKARIAAMRDLFDRSGGRIRRLQIEGAGGKVGKGDKEKWLKHWKTTKVK